VGVAFPELRTGVLLVLLHVGESAGISLCGVPLLMLSCARSSARREIESLLVLSTCSYCLGVPGPSLVGE